jgi:hypothetical protein
VSRNKAKDVRPRAFLKEIDTNTTSDPDCMDIDDDTGNTSSPRASTPSGTISVDTDSPSSPPPAGTKRGRDSQADNESMTKKVKLPDPPFIKGFIQSGNGPKASDYIPTVAAVINRARHDYQSRILALDPFPAKSTRDTWASSTWKKALKIGNIEYSLTDRVKSIVSVYTPQYFSHCLLLDLLWRQHGTRGCCDCSH